LAADCFGGIVFTSPDANEQVKKISFKVAESPEGGAITLGVANSSLFKDRDYEINYGSNQDIQKEKPGCTECALSASCPRT
jgi:hypothetical protein